MQKRHLLVKRVARHGDAMFKLNRLPLSTPEAISFHGKHVNSPVSLDVTSETGPLRQVLVHTPGAELEQVEPDSRLDLLFDDLLYMEQAREEHLLMCALFEKITRRADAVLQVTDLLRETFEQEAARYDFIEQICSISQVSNLQAFEREFKQFTPDELYRFALTGDSPLPINVPPLPNLLFTRDLAAVVGRHIVVSHAATAARARESILMGVVLRHHPAFAEHGDRIIELPPSVTLEGGDVLVASPEVVLIGHSERTSMGGVMAAAQALLERTSVKHVLAVDLPKRRSSMHLDTVFTFCTPSECVVFPPSITAREASPVLHLQLGDAASGGLLTTVRPHLQDVLEELLGRALAFIPCGGPAPLSQQREQWTDGANFFAVAPGVVVGYERNAYTFETMRQHGYRVVSAQEVLSEEDDYEPNKKVAIKLAGTELSRGRGGPRCMTLPLARD